MVRSTEFEESEDEQIDIFDVKVRLVSTTTHTVYYPFRSYNELKDDFD